MKENLIKQENRERIHYTIPDLPLYARQEWLSSYPNKTGIAHWHNDVEFLVILQGELLYSVNGIDHLVKQGEGIFVNSRSLHFGHSCAGADCEFICLIFPFSLIGSSPLILGKYVNPVIHNQKVSCVCMRQDEVWCQPVIKWLKEIFYVCQSKEPAFELTAVRLFFQIWKSIYQYIIRSDQESCTFDDKHIQELRNMIEFIQCRYQEKITLEQIAAAGKVCRSSCCSIFQKLLRKSPIVYLMDFRIYKSAELLCDATLTVTEIAYQCGFSSTSYFIKVFRQSMGMTPTAYRGSQNLKKEFLNPGIRG